MKKREITSKLNLKNKKLKKKNEYIYGVMYNEQHDHEEVKKSYSYLTRRSY